MVGILELTEEKGRGPAVAGESLLGLPCLRAVVSHPAGLRESRARRRVERGGRALARAGVRRVLTAAGFPYWPELAKSGLQPVEVEGFCQALAAPLALAALERLGAPPAQAVVALSGPAVSRPLLQAAQTLCPRVRCLSIGVGTGGEELADWLWREFGAATVGPGAGERADVALWFGPGGAAGGTVLRLYGPRPDLAGFFPVPPKELGRTGLDGLTVLALLWEEGRLDCQKIRISST